MKSKILICFVGCIGALCLLVGWSQTHLDNLSSLFVPADPFGKQEALQVTARAYTPEQSTAALRKDLVRRGIQPLEITIQNHTAKTFSLCPSSVDLPSLTPKRVASKASSSPLRAFGFRLLSFFFWPATIPSTIDTMIRMKSHASLKGRYEAVGMRKELVAPFSTVHRILFVPKGGFHDAFQVTLIELDTLQRTPIEVVAT